MCKRSLPVLYFCEFLRADIEVSKIRALLCGLCQVPLPKQLKYSRVKSDAYFKQESQHLLDCPPFHMHWKYRKIIRNLYITHSINKLFIQIRCNTLKHPKSHASSVGGLCFMTALIFSLSCVSLTKLLTGAIRLTTVPITLHAGPYVGLCSPNPNTPLLLTDWYHNVSPGIEMENDTSHFRVGIQYRPTLWWTRRN